MNTFDRCASCGQPIASTNEKVRVEYAELHTTVCSEECVPDAVEWLAECSITLLNEQQPLSDDEREQIAMEEEQYQTLQEITEDTIRSEQSLCDNPSVHYGGDDCDDAVNFSETMWENSIDDDDDLPF